MAFWGAASMVQRGWAGEPKMSSPARPFFIPIHTCSPRPPSAIVSCPPAINRPAFLVDYVPPADTGLTIIHADADLLVLDKPAGLLSRAWAR